MLLWLCSSNSLPDCFRDVRGVNDFLSQKAVGLYDTRNAPRPAGLVTGAYASAVVTMKVFVEENKIAPMGIELELLRGAVNRTAPLVVALECPDQTFRKFLGDLKQAH